jgi:hypothetical protein
VPPKGALVPMGKPGCNGGLAGSATLCPCLTARRMRARASAPSWPSKASRHSGSRPCRILSSIALLYPGLILPSEGGLRLRAHPHSAAAGLTYRGTLLSTSSALSAPLGKPGGADPCGVQVRGCDLVTASVSEIPGRLEVTCAV